MMKTEAVSVIRSAAFLAYLSIGIVVDIAVFGLISAKNKIFYPVVILDSIYVVNDFIFRKIPSYFFFHDKSVLHDSTMRCCMWVIESLNNHVSTWVIVPSSFVALKYLRIVSHPFVKAFSASDGRSLCQRSSAINAVVHSKGYSSCGYLGVNPV